MAAFWQKENGKRRKVKIDIVKSFKKYRKSMGFCFAFIPYCYQKFSIIWFYFTILDDFIYFKTHTQYNIFKCYLYCRKNFLEKSNSFKERESSEDELDEETLANIVREAELTPDVCDSILIFFICAKCMYVHKSITYIFCCYLNQCFQEPIVEKKTFNSTEGTPEKKKGLFGRMFKK